MVTGHGNINSYLHRFKISDTPSCPCGTQDKVCELSWKERNYLTTITLKTDVWPTSKPKLIRKHFKAFFKFTNAFLIDTLTNPKPDGDS
jgi:hypothetical protein